MRRRRPGVIGRNALCSAPAAERHGQPARPPGPTISVAGEPTQDAPDGTGEVGVEVGRLDLIYYSVIPWVSFTSFKHASRLDPTRSVPRIVFGKMFDEASILRVADAYERATGWHREAPTL